MNERFLPAIFRIMAVTLLVLAAGCATRPQKGAAAESVEQRAVQRWENLIAGKAREAYEYLTPGYRAVKDKEAYAYEMAARPVKWTAVKFLEKACAEPNVCSVRLEITFKVRIHAAMMGEVESVSIQNENWIKVRDVWHHLPEKLGAQGLR